MSVEDGAEVTVMSTTTGEWQTRRYDAATDVWQTVASGPVIIETWGDLPTIRCSLLPQGSAQAGSNGRE